MRRALPGALVAAEVVQACHYLDLEPVPRSTGMARRFVRTHAPVLPAETEDSLLLLTSELVTNALIHARTQIEVGVAVTAEAVVVSVHDLDLASPLQEPYGDREGGWGLGLVGALAQSWSTTRHREGGKSVWFRLLSAAAPAVRDGAAARTPRGGTDE